jgi:hypothetical protein
MTPKGCWNCAHAVSRNLPREWTPGTTYIAGCRAPGNEEHSAKKTHLMTAENTDADICRFHYLREAA